MPELKFVRLTIERMKSVAPKIIFKMSKGIDEGGLILSASTYNVQCTVTFNDLKVINLGENFLLCIRSLLVISWKQNYLTFSGDDDLPPASPIIRGSQEHYSIEVDMKSILHLLPSEGAKPTSMICSEKLAHFY